MPLLMLLVFALTLFTSATLLFLVQPMVGKMITPLLGGSPAVWNTCMVFFQALLLAGYAYSHAATAWLGARRQAILHLLVLVVPFAFFPLVIDRSKALGADREPVATVLLLLTFSVGVPFLVVSTSAPLLQKWFASTDHPAARDPYFLYGASNLGSMLALLGYPTVVEPWLTLADQRWLWCAGYGLLTALVAGCAVSLWRSAPAAEPAGEAPPPVGPEPSVPVPPTAFASRPLHRPGRHSKHVKGAPPKPAPPPAFAAGSVTAVRRLRWVALAAVPSSLMLGATTYMTTDIAAIPLLWVLPLALYLLSFILVFSKIPESVQATTLCLVVLTGLGVTAKLIPGYVGQDRDWIQWAGLAACAVGAVASLWLAFLRDPRLIHRAFVLALPLLILLLLFVMLSSGARPPHLLLVLGLHLGTLFAAAMVCHGELALDRPAPRHLTEFFLWMSLGGVLGGLFNALVAPLVFNGIVEYQLALVAACFLVPPLSAPGKEARWDRTADFILLALFAVIGGALLNFRLQDHDLVLAALRGRAGYLAAAAIFGVVALGVANAARGGRRSAAAFLDVAIPLALVLLVVGLIWGLPARQVWGHVSGFAGSIHVDEMKLFPILAYGVPAVLCYNYIDRPLRFGLCVGALALGAAVCSVVTDRCEFQDRSFFGVLRVEKRERKLKDDQGKLTTFTLMHGTTWHGSQHRRLDEPDDDLAVREIPLSYYHRSGPAGHVFGEYNKDPSRPFGIIGLGTGTMACYALPDQHVTFYDIDPVVRGISFDTDRFFTYVSDARARGATLDLVMGDARLTMERQHPSEDEKYGLLVVDAFSSDAIPVHLITWEALQLYWEHMRPDGIVLFHISNRYLNLRPVLANFAAKGNLTGYVFNDLNERAPGKAISTWVALARAPEHLDRLLTDPDWSEMQKTLRAATLLPGSPVLQAPWKPLTPDPKVGVWTDDYSNLLSVFDWGS